MPVPFSLWLAEQALMWKYHIVKAFKKKYPVLNVEVELLYLDLDDIIEIRDGMWSNSI
jgi:hypothetical protein